MITLESYFPLWKERYGEEQALRIVKIIEGYAPYGVITGTIAAALNPYQLALIHIIEAAHYKRQAVIASTNLARGFAKISAALQELSQKVKAIESIRSDPIIHQPKKRGYPSLQNPRYFAPASRSTLLCHKKGYYQQVKRQRHYKRQKRRNGRRHR